MPNDQIIKIFISYSRHDTLIAQSIADVLEEHGYSPWLDINIKVGQDWQSEIVQEINSSDIMILLMSPDALRSQWIQREYLIFLNNQKPLIPIIIRELDYSNIPSELRAIQWLRAEAGLQREQLNQLLNALAYYTERMGKQPPITTTKRQPHIEPPLIVGAKSDGSPAAEALLQQQMRELPVQASTSNLGIAPPAASPRTFSESSRGLSAISDKPVRGSTEDLLGFKNYADAISAFIMHRHTDKPLTLSISAEWGGGKSSLMYMIRDQLTDKLPTVWFNAWAYKGEEALWAALVLSIIEQAVLAQPFWKRFWLQQQLVRFNSRLLLLDILRGLIYLILVAGFGLLAVLIITLLQNAPLTATVNQVLPLVLVGGGGIGLYQFGKMWLSDIQSLLNLNIDKYVEKKPDYEGRIGFLMKFQDNFKRLVKVVTNNYRHPMVIFIDDLDRCSVPKVAELVEAMSIFLSADGCVFIVGMDTKTVAASIEINYGSLRDYLANKATSDDPALGRFFLEKIVQISFPIPRVGDNDMMRFVRKNMGEVVEPSPEDTSPDIADLHQRLSNELSKLQSASEVYDFVNEKMIGFVEAEEMASGNADHAAATLETLQRQQQKHNRIKHFTRKIFAAEILERFNEMTEVMDVIEKMLPYLDYNPRRVKRFINVLRLQAFIAIKRGSLVDSLQLNALTTLLQIALRWPDFAVEMINDPHVDDDLFFVSSTLVQFGNEADKVRDLEGFQSRLKSMEDLQKKPVISKFQHETDLINLLPKTTAFTDEVAVDILKLALQIVAGTRLKQLTVKTSIW
jgi:hypothetical protein